VNDRWRAPHFLTREGVEEGETGTPEADVRLDQGLTAPRLPSCRIRPALHPRAHPFRWGLHRWLHCGLPRLSTLGSSVTAPLTHEGAAI
jgi:hypothetical protein